ncbi:MAG: 4Fe-4S ferredoxin [Bacteroidetes bacterium CG18_big_fil_WC_8_21_14_2_50_41_14]|nr:MAG: 4Fe-4S ferredoxin [Bacteroidetes bacterium CG18_big_fil_WC_8_21_14_2_50_41_14]PJB54999.1 MAG: 4Fe-4S ferredoxin [Bacteroidetes bacterium CG_4_9_14_3_um_filter_41_19]
MELIIEQILVYAVAIFFCLFVVVIYLRSQKRKSNIVEEKIAQAKIDGLYEPVSLHPVVDIGSCIATGACIQACPEKDILGIRNGKATTINASHCIGHGACFHACPTEAISLHIGTEKRGVELPHVSQEFETNIPGIFIAGELGGMGLIKNAVEQGKQAVENIAKSLKSSKHAAEYDLIVVGAGPAGISATLTAKKHDLKCLTLEQDTLGGTVFTFPRSKIVMTSAMDLPLHGKVKLFETSKTELLGLWQTVLSKNNISIRENSKIESIERMDGFFKVGTKSGEHFNTRAVLLAIGRRGTPRKLNVPGEELEKVAYRLLEPEDIQGKNIVVVGGGDSAVESALLLADNNKVILSYRGENFGRIKPRNGVSVQEAVEKGILDLRFNTNLAAITKDEVVIRVGSDGESTIEKNDLVYIFAGGELPTQFLEKVGINITKKFGEAILRH